MSLMAMKPYSAAQYTYSRVDRELERRPPYVWAWTAEKILDFIDHYCSRINRLVGLSQLPRDKFSWQLIVAERPSYSFAHSKHQRSVDDADGRKRLLHCNLEPFHLVDRRKPHQDEHVRRAGDR